MDTNEIQNLVKVQLDRAIGAYQSYQSGTITRVDFNHNLDLIAASTTQHIIESYDDGDDE